MTKSPNPKVRSYGHLLFSFRLEKAREEANRMFLHAESQGKFISVEYEPGIICGGEWVISDEMPV